jgi:hypothetical protein
MPGAMRLFTAGFAVPKSGVFGGWRTVIAAKLHPPVARGELQLSSIAPASATSGIDTPDAVGCMNDGYAGWHGWA